MTTVPSIAVRVRDLVAVTSGQWSGADDWPQWLGPQRDSVWRETGILDTFPAAGPTVLWRHPVGGGFAGPAVADGRVFVMDYVTDKQSDSLRQPARQVGGNRTRALPLRRRRPAAVETRVRASLQHLVSRRAASDTDRGWRSGLHPGCGR